MSDKKKKYFDYSSIGAEEDEFGVKTFKLDTTLIPQYPKHDISEISEESRKLYHGTANVVEPYIHTPEPGQPRKREVSPIIQAVLEQVSSPFFELQESGKKFEEGKPGQGAIKAVQALLHTAFLPFTVPFTATTSTLKETGLTPVAEGMEQTLQLPFEGVKQASQGYSELLRQLGLENQIIVNKDFDQSLNDLLQEIMGLGLIKGVHGLKKGIKTPAPGLVDVSEGKLPAELQPLRRVSTDVELKPILQRVEPKQTGKEILARQKEELGKEEPIKVDRQELYDLLKETNGEEIATKLSVGLTTEEARYVLSGGRQGKAVNQARVDQILKKEVKNAVLKPGAEGLDALKQAEVSKKVGETYPERKEAPKESIKKEEVKPEKGETVVSDIVEPAWKSLETLLDKGGIDSKRAVQGFMYMSTGTAKGGETVYHFKHGLTRKYITVDKEGNIYLAKKDAIIKGTDQDIPNELKKVYENIEKFYVPGGKGPESRGADVYTPYNEEYIKGRNEALEKKGYKVLGFNLEESPAEIKAKADLLKSWTEEGKEVKPEVPKKPNNNKKIPHSWQEAVLQYFVQGGRVKVAPEEAKALGLSARNYSEKGQSLDLLLTQLGFDFAHKEGLEQSRLVRDLLYKYDTHEKRVQALKELRGELKQEEPEGWAEKQQAYERLDEVVLNEYLDPDGKLRTDEIVKDSRKILDRAKVDMETFVDYIKEKSEEPIKKEPIPEEEPKTVERLKVAIKRLEDAIEKEKKEDVFGGDSKAIERLQNKIKQYQAKIAEEESKLFKAEQDKVLKRMSETAFKEGFDQKKFAADIEKEADLKQLRLWKTQLEAMGKEGEYLLDKVERKIKVITYPGKQEDIFAPKQEDIFDVEKPKPPEVKKYPHPIFNKLEDMYNERVSWIEKRNVSDDLAISLSGDRNKQLRQEITSAFEGKKIPVNESNISRLMLIFRNWRDKNTDFLSLKNPEERVYEPKIGDLVEYKGENWEVGFVNQTKFKGTVRLQKPGDVNAKQINYIDPEELKFTGKNVSEVVKPEEKAPEVKPQNIEELRNEYRKVRDELTQKQHDLNVSKNESSKIPPFIYKLREEKAGDAAIQSYVNAYNLRNKADWTIKDAKERIEKIDQLWKEQQSLENDIAKLKLNLEDISRRGKALKPKEEPVKKPSVDQNQVKRLRKLAEGMQNQIDNKLNPAVAQQNPTARRARIAGHMEKEGRILEEIQTAMNTIADHMEKGTLPESLSKVSSRADVETIRKIRKDNAENAAYIHISELQRLVDIVKGKKGAAEIKERIYINSDGWQRNPKVIEAINDLYSLAKKHSDTDPLGGRTLKDNLAEFNRRIKLGIETTEKALQAKEDYDNLMSGKIGKETPEQIKIREKERELIGLKIPGYFDTRGEALERVMDLADIKEGMDVLEPSAGKGNIADRINEITKPDVVEYNNTLRDVLEAKGHNLVGADFLEYKGKSYDRIVMNPPFEKFQDIDHVRHAYELLKPGGKLVSIMGEGTFFRTDKKAAEFREWFEDKGGFEEKLPEKAFMGPGGSRSTGVASRVVVIEKPGTSGSQAAAYSASYSTIGPKILQKSIKHPSKFSESDLNDVVRLKDIGTKLSQDIEMVLGQEVRTGRRLINRFNSRAKGLYFHDTGIVRIYNMNDVGVLAHELGHKLDFEIFKNTEGLKFKDKIELVVVRLSGLKNQQRRAKVMDSLRRKYGTDIVDSVLERKELRDELKAFGSGIGKHFEKLHESIAEFVSSYIVDPQVVRQKCPKFYNLYENLLDANPAIRSAMLSARDGIKRFQEQDARKITESTIVRDLETDSFINKIKRIGNEFFYKVIDSTEPFRKLEDALKEKDPQLKGKDNPLLQVLSLIGVDGKAKEFLENHPFVKKGNDINIMTDRKPFFKIFEKMLKEGTLKSHEGYLTALRNLELYNNKKGAAATTTLDIAKETKELYEKDFGKDYLDDLVYNLRKYNDALLDYYSASGKISSETLAEIKELNQYYVPFKRFFEEWENTGRMPNVGKYVRDSSPSPVKRIRGSQREIVSPIGSVIKNTYDMIAAADRNTALKTIIESMQKVDDSLVQEIPPRVMKPVNVIREPEKIIDPITGQTLMSLPREGEGFTEKKIGVFYEKPQGESIVTVWEGGKPKYYQIPKEFYDSFFAMNEQVAEAIKILSGPSRLLQAGAVVYDPTFSVRNIFRDLMSAFFYSEHGFKPIDFLRGVKSGIKKSEAYQKFLASGADQSFLTAMDQMMSKQYIEGKSGSRIQTTWQRYRRNPLEVLRDINRATELGTRIGAFKRAYEKTGDVYKAMQEGREISADYGVKGLAMKNVSPLYPFFNARIQHMKRSLQSIKNHPGRTLSKGIVFVAGPTILNWINNNMEENTRKLYYDLPMWRRVGLFNIKIPYTDTFLPIPKGFFGVLFGSSTEAILDYSLRENPRLLQELPEQLLTELMPLSSEVELAPQAVRPIIEQFANKKGYQRSPIVSERLKGLEQEDQFTDATSEFAKFVGQVTGISPARIDAFLISYTAGAGSGALKISDEVLEQLGITEPSGQDTFSKLGRLPLTRALVTETPLGTRGQSVQDFYEKLDELESINKEVNSKIKNNQVDKLNDYLEDKKEDYRFYLKNQTEINKFKQVLTAVRDLRYQIAKDPEITDKRGLIREIEEEVTDMAKAFTEAYNSKKKFSLSKYMKEILAERKKFLGKKNREIKHFKSEIK